MWGTCAEERFLKKFRKRLVYALDADVVITPVCYSALFVAPVRIAESFWTDAGGDNKRLMQEKMPVAVVNPDMSLYNRESSPVSPLWPATFMATTGYRGE